MHQTINFEHKTAQNEDGPYPVLEPISIPLSEILEDHSVTTPGTTGIHTDEELSRLRIALSRLTPQERKVFEMKVLEDGRKGNSLTYKDIATRLGVSHHRIQRVYQKALWKLRLRLRD